MTGQLIPFNQSGPAQLPAHIAAAFGDDEGNTAGRATIDQLSYRGKIWRLVVKGEESPLMKTDNETGERVPVQSVTLVVVGLNKARSRSYYEGAYEDGKNAAPICYSADGVTPDASVKAPQSPTCASCAWSVKGSKITESNKQTTACSPFKRVAVVPSQRIDSHPVLLLRMAQTSVWDKDADGKDGYYAWDQYVDMLRARGAIHTALVETRVKFDHNVPYPKLLFKAERWLDAAEIAAAKTRIVDDAEVIATALAGGANDGVMGQPAAAPATRAQGTMQTQKSPVPPVAQQQMVDISAMMEEIATPPAPAPVAAPTPPKAPPKVPVKAPEPVFPPEGWAVHPEDPAYYFKDDDVITEAELRARVQPPAPAIPPAPPKVPRKPRAVAPATTKVQAEPVGDDDGFGASTQPPAATATPTEPTTVETTVPAGLAGLLDGWDAP